jgi:hypothetical protein
LLPSADLVLCLAVWHHLVSDFGLETADRMLSTIWARTRRALVFETGESEMPAQYRLPAMEPDPATWIQRHLRETCPGGDVVSLGRHTALRPEGGTCVRSLFAVIRRDAPTAIDGAALS